MPDKVANFVGAQSLYGASAPAAAGWRRERARRRPGSAARPGEELVDRIAAIASDRKAIDIRVLDVRGIVGYTDFFVICSGNTERQTKAIHDAIHQRAEGRRRRCRAGPRASARRAGC